MSQKVDFCFARGILEQAFEKASDDFYAYSSRFIDEVSEIILGEHIRIPSGRDVRFGCGIVDVDARPAVR